jgi:hypothetical protein
MSAARGAVERSMEQRIERALIVAVVLGFKARRSTVLARYVLADWARKVRGAL